PNRLRPQGENSFSLSLSFSINDKAHGQKGLDDDDDIRNSFRLSIAVIARTLRSGLRTETGLLPTRTLRAAIRR
ncbi:MAG: hypothetical protein AAF501_21195, partial [Pseudomonadota bacterium]